MQDPLRFIDGEGSSLERRLLQAARAERPSQRSRRRAAAALAVHGLGASWALTAAAGPVAKVLHLGLAGVGKWLALATLGAAGTWGVVHYVADPVATGGADARSVGALRRSAPVVSEHLEALRLAQEHETKPQPPQADVPVGDGSSGESATVQPSAGRRQRAVSSAAVDPRASIRSQIKLIDRARAAVGASQSQRALALVREYSAQYPGGAFTEEASLLRIEALAQAGESATALRLARAFEARHPDSPHLRRLHSLLGEPDASP